jgi:hypothetical protein
VLAEDQRVEAEAARQADLLDRLPEALDGGVAGRVLVRQEEPEAHGSLVSLPG